MKDDTLITSHRLVPKHTKMSEKAVKELLDKYNIVKSQLPKILSSDSIIKLIDAKTGDVIKIERTSPTKGVAEYYRVVTDG